MADKCSICGKELEESFLGKIKGTFVRVGGKLKQVCSQCQSQYKDKLKEEL